MFAQLTMFAESRSRRADSAESIENNISLEELSRAEYMRMRDFIFHEPESIEKASELLERFGDDARIIAGGTDLLVDLKQQNITVSHLISISRLDYLNHIEENEGKLKIGALATLNSVAKSERVAGNIKALCEAAGSMASDQIRNVGTIGGNIASAVPSADIPPTLIAAGAAVVVKGADGDRNIPLNEFFLGPRKTAMTNDEILTHVIIPRLPKDTGISYKKLKLRGSNALAVAAVASGITLDGGVIRDGIFVLGAVAPIPMVAEQASEMLKGRMPDDDLFKKASKMASREARPISDIRGSKEYREELVEVLALRAVKEAYARAKGGV